ncbi:MAG TPA: hypothetical protein DEF34_07935 [Desulfotomaculum sp.]|nr:MAG: hypothetical protein VR67_05095 [Peptococcaceae bacterium BRH_c8a]KJS72322.1 MAG: hypothetical protein JL56_13285 [Desulfotomaculum sp. BICA1-6]HBX23542.1 hypothetical protein [Desulfotomaculum sp.]
MLKAAFIFLAPGAEPSQHKADVQTPEVELKVVGVQDYQAAEEVIRKLVSEGVKAIELCGGFGHEGVARATRAAGNVAVGAVRFDVHPGLNCKSGDSLF